MKTYRVVLFDLDGTLADPKIGITKSLQYALRKMELPARTADELVSFIGPPLHVSFTEQFGLDEQGVEKAVSFYRERFKTKGLYENVIYPAIPELLAELKANGIVLAVATSKPTEYAMQILQHFGILHFFDYVVGSNLDGTRSAKTEVIEELLRLLPKCPPQAIVMVGDRKHDLIGANNTGIDSVGVLYGFGSLEELCKEHPTFLANDIEQLQEILLGTLVAEA